MRLYEVKDFIETSKDLLAAHVIIHSQWPPPPPEWWKAIKKNLEGEIACTVDTQTTAVRGQHKSHFFVDLGNGTHQFCLWCFHFKHKNAVSYAICNNFPRGFGHKLAIATSTVDTDAAIICSHCSRWTPVNQRRPWVSKPCNLPGKPNQAKDSAWKRVNKGRHPSSASNKTITDVILLAKISIRLLKNIPGTSKISHSTSATPTTSSG